MEIRKYQNLLDKIIVYIYIILIYLKSGNSDLQKIIEAKKTGKGTKI